MVGGTQEDVTRSSESSEDWRRSFEPPSLSLPKGGGAIRGIGEKFTANPVTGTGRVSIPLALSPGRGGATPAIDLAYDSGAGNSVVGLGGQFRVPAITRGTDRRLPTYDDARESDIFLLSDVEDLVPVLEQQGAAWRRPAPRTAVLYGKAYEITTYRPRVEGLFAQIERWTRHDRLDTVWRTISRDNVKTWYGKTPESRIVDPSDPTRVFSWLISESVDDRGHATLYQYQREDRQNVDSTLACERSRADAPPTAMVHLKRVLYGNAESCLVEPDLGAQAWMFEVVFDYGEGHYHEEPPTVDGDVFAAATAVAPPGQAWPVRADPFSNYRATFEQRTYRLCRRVLMFHRLPALGPEPVLVKSTDFTYDERPEGTRLKAVTQSGYVKWPGRGLLKRSLPPVEFDYSPSPSQSDLDGLVAQTLAPDQYANLPVGLDESEYRWTDLDGEGIAGVLARRENAWYYRRNLGHARLGPLETLPQPPVARVDGPRAAHGSGRRWPARRGCRRVGAPRV